MPEFYVGEEPKSIVTKKCIICDGIIAIDSPESVCPHCKSVLNWLKYNIEDLISIVEREKNKYYKD